MLAIYSIFFNVMWQSGSMPGFDLFYYVKKPTTVSHYSLRFTDVNGEIVSEPLYLDSPNDWIVEDDRHEALDLVNKLGIAVYAGDFEKAEQLHTELVNGYFSQIESAKYELVLRVVNPVERYAPDAAPLADQLIETYEYQRLVGAN